MVNVVACIEQSRRRHRVHDLVLFIESSHGSETKISRRRLHTVLGAFCQLKCHGPIVEHHVHDIRHSPCDSAHAIPHVRRKHGNIGWERFMQALKQRAHLVVPNIGL